ncbi:MAG: RHS repeat-associated core domain-containing protein [Pseudomonadota bacterium]
MKTNYRNKFPVWAAILFFHTLSHAAATIYVMGPTGPLQEVVANATTQTVCTSSGTASGTIALNKIKTKAAASAGGTTGTQTCTQQTVTTYDKVWLHPDYQGSIHLVTKPDGSPALTTIYKPYGEPLSKTGSHIESLSYTGQRQDSSTGLFYLHARYYDPALSRFISPDPITPGKEIVKLNHYAYADNDPVNNTDVNGMQSTAVASSTGVGGLTPQQLLEIKAAGGMGYLARSSITPELKQGAAPQAPGPFDAKNLYEREMNARQWTKFEVIGTIASLAVLPEGEGAVYLSKALPEVNELSKIAARATREVKEAGGVCRHFCIKAGARAATKGYLPTVHAAANTEKEIGHAILELWSSKTGNTYWMDWTNVRIGGQEVKEAIFSLKVPGGVQAEYPVAPFWSDVLKVGERSKLGKW